jgi:hypothetical protein
VEDKLFILHKLHNVGIDQIRKVLDGEGLIEKKFEKDNEAGIQVRQYCERVHAAQVWSIRKNLLNAYHYQEYTHQEIDMFSFT